MGCGEPWGKQSRDGLVAVPDLIRDGRAVPCPHCTAHPSGPQQEAPSLSHSNSLLIQPGFLFLQG